LRGLRAGYGNREVLHGVDLEIESKEIIALIGHNGAGKTTALRAIFGLTPSSGSITFRGWKLSNSNSMDRVRSGLSYVPDGRQLFADLSVDQNLKMAGTGLERPTLRNRMSTVCELFPILASRTSQRAGTMSGGEQQMLNVAMGLMTEPKLIMLDEPSVGLAPVVVERLLAGVRTICDRFGTSVLLVEQNVRQAVRIADRVLVMKGGRIIKELRHEDEAALANLWEYF
jgi:branched-chain amino acid transport system ATP-binding protein